MVLKAAVERASLGPEHRSEPLLEQPAEMAVGWATDLVETAPGSEEREEAVEPEFRAAMAEVGATGLAEPAPGLEVAEAAVEPERPEDMAAGAGQMLAEEVAATAPAVRRQAWDRSRAQVREWDIPAAVILAEEKRSPVAVL